MNQEFYVSPVLVKRITALFCGENYSLQLSNNFNILYFSVDGTGVVFIWKEEAESLCPSTARLHINKIYWTLCQKRPLSKNRKIELKLSTSA